MMHAILDFDGTLSDSFDGIYYSFVEACRLTGIEIPDQAKLKSLIGPPIEQICTALYPSLEAERVELFRQSFRDIYDGHGYLKSNWYPLVPYCIQKLADSGVVLHVVTNKPTLPTRQLLQQDRLQVLIRNIIGIDYLKVHELGERFTSKSQALTYLTTSLHLDASSPALYCGDTPADMHAAAQNDLAFLPVCYGYHQWETNELAPYPFTLENPRQMASIIFTMLQNQLNAII